MIVDFGDRIADATAELAREPLLFKGEDFAHTDIASALAPAGASSRRPKR